MIGVSQPKLVPGDRVLEDHEYEDYRCHKDGCEFCCLGVYVWQAFVLLDAADWFDYGYEG